MSLRGRVAELERDIAERTRTIHESSALISDWRKELAEAKGEIRRELAQPSIRHGIDLAYGHPNPAALRALGVSFVCRYYSFDDSKNLSRSEAEDYSHHGLSIVSVWENDAEDAKQGYDAGVYAAKAAGALAHGVGQPLESPIFFAVDFDTTGCNADEWDHIKGYFTGAGDYLGKERVGVYGGLETVRQVQVAYRWQTLAWSGTPTVWARDAQLRQTDVDVLVAGTQCDLDTAVTHNFGQWRI